MIFGDIGLPELVPLNVMGEGMVRVARLVLSIAKSPKGVVLVDEIENGIHHSAMEKVWAAVSRAANEYDTQVFATTHSLECVHAAHQAIPEGLRLHRLQPDTGRTSVAYGTDEIEAAVRHNVEVR